MNKLAVSSDKAFYSLQGEGPTMGRRAVFLRLAHCTLSCRWCDTTSVWKESTPYMDSELYQYMKDLGYWDQINTGARLVLTGGSPLLQQANLARFLAYASSMETLPKSRNWKVEVETEGVLMPDELVGWVRQWNVSPKLSNSGMPEAKRYIPSVLKVHSKLNSWFKFVVDTHQLEADLSEIQYIQVNSDIAPERIWLMPACSTQAEHAVAAPLVAACALSAGYNFSPRLQVVLWGKTVGV